MTSPEELEAALEVFANKITDEWRAQANVSPLVVRVCTIDAEGIDEQRWDAYAVDFVTVLIGGALDVSATETLGPDDRQALQVTCTIPDDGLGTAFRRILADVAKRHGITPYTSWTEIPARLRLDHW